ncbi:MAG: hypothetical protein GKC10_07715 [Methanosarcinales archaeon]|nr:hypothetical protein [Methanosarcinales archaeon]
MWCSHSDLVRSGSTWGAFLAVHSGPPIPGTVEVLGVQEVPGPGRRAVPSDSPLSRRFGGVKGGIGDSFKSWIGR